MLTALRVPLLSICLAVLQLFSLSSQACAQQDWGQSLRARGGLSYFQDTHDSQVGALYGLDMSVPMFEQANLYGSFTHNHFDQGSQFIGTLGSYRQGQADGDLLQRFSGGLLFDQYTDTRFDGLYLSQLRSFLGFAITENLGAGVTYTDPLEDADSVTLALPGGGTGPVTLRNAELLEGYLSMRWGQNLITAAIGQRQDPNDLVASLYGTHQLNSKLGLYTNTSYSDSHSWASTFGLQWTFGPGPKPGLLSSTNETSTTLVRAQNSGGPCNPYTDPSLGHNLNYDPQRFGSLITRDAVPPSGDDDADTDTLSTTGGSDPPETEGEPDPKPPIEILYF